MALANKLLDLLNCTIRFSTPEGVYEGILKKVIPSAELVVVGKVILLPGRRMGTLNFLCFEMSNIRVISQPDSPKERNAGKKDILPVYPKTKMEKLFDFDKSSDIEDGESADDCNAEYEMKLVTHLSKLVPRDFQIINCFNKEFHLAIKHIKKQYAIGVSLEGIEVSRSGILTWLCISTTSCNFLFDVLALGGQAFQKGLKSILEDSQIQKILHDCRLASDCLYHQYSVRLVNVFDTQVADFIVMMQMNEKDKIESRVNTLDACLSYYLEIPCDFLYGHAKFDDNKDSLNYHALRPLRHEIQDVLIKNVMYLHLLKRELEIALQTPLRRATDVYLNCVQKLPEKELEIVPHRPDELPTEVHLEGIQIFRYRDFEYINNTVASGPPYRAINNPMKAYLNYHAEYKNGQKKDKDSVVNKDVNQIAIFSEFNYKANGSNLKSGKFVSRLKSSGVNLSKSDNDCSDNSEKNQSSDYCDVKTNETLRDVNSGNTFVSSKNIMKSEVSKCSKSSTAENPIMRGLLEVLSKQSGENNATYDESSHMSRGHSQTSAENFGMDSESAMRDSYNTNELSQFKTETSQIQRPFTIRKKSSCELLELISKMRPLNLMKVADTSSDENSANERDSVKNDSTAKLLQINNSVLKKDESCADSDLEEVTARVRARGALLHNCKPKYSASDCESTSDFINSQAIEDICRTSGSNLECASENVTVCYNETIDQQSQFVVKVNHKSRRLADLYKKAGDGDLLWTEEDPETVSKSFCNQPNECVSKENIWTSVLNGEPCGLINEKLRLRLIPAGMQL